MKVTIEVDDVTLKHYLVEDWDALYLIFDASDGKKAEKIKNLLLWDQEDNWPKKKKRLDKIEKSDIKDFEVSIPFIYEQKFKIIKIEPNEKQR